MSALRVFLAVLVLGIGVAGAVAISTVTAGTGCKYAFNGCTPRHTPTWVIPVAVLAGFAGLAGCAAILASGYRRRGSS